MSDKIVDSKCTAYLNSFAKIAARKVAVVVAAAAVLFGLVNTGLAQVGAPPIYNGGIVDFAHRKLSTTVGNGQCGDYVVIAMECAGASPVNVEGTNRVWGAPIDKKWLRAGDIIQLNGTGTESVFHKTPTDNDVTAYRWFDLHTMIVASYDPNTDVVTWYHQNWDRHWFKEDTSQLSVMTAKLQLDRFGEPILLSGFDGNGAGKVVYYRANTARKGAIRQPNPCE